MRVFVLLLAFVLWTQSQPSSSGHESVANNKQAQKTNQPPNTVVQQQNFYPEIGDQKNHAEANRPTKPPHDWVDWVNAFSTLVVAFFTALLFGAVVWQTKTSRDTERAWVIASPVEASPDFGFIPPPGNNLQAHLTGANKLNTFGCAFKNTGNTPARLTQVDIRYLTASSKTDIPSEPSYKNEEEILLNDLPLVKGDSIGYESTLEPNPILSKSDCDAVYTGQMFVYAFGRIAYRDVYGRKHETGFGFLYHAPKGGDRTPRGFRREGMPADYNKAT